MLDLMTPKEKYENIIDLLDKQQLGKALDEMLRFSELVPDSNVGEDILNMKTTYNSLLHFAHEDITDVERYKVFNNLMARCYTLSDNINDNIKGQTSTLFQTTRSNVQHKQFRSISDYQLMFEAYVEDSALNELLQEKQKHHDAMLHHEELQKEMFDYLWVSESWDEEKKTQAGNFMDSLIILPEDKTIFVTAITFSILHSPDEKKMLFLLQQRKCEDYVIKIRALTGFVLASYLYNKRIPFFSKLSLYMSLLEENDKIALGAILTDIQSTFIKQLDTYKINLMIRNEIIPQLLKANMPGSGPLNIISEEDLMDEDKNPEWSEEKENRLEEKINKITEWQMEGKDTNYTTFSQMREVAFFKEISNWLLPFSLNTTFVEGLLEQTDNSDLLRGFLLSNALLCDSDRYSLCFLIGKYNTSTLNVIIESLRAQEEGLKVFTEEFKNSKNDFVIRNYIQDLFRFYTLFHQRREFTNPFEKNINLLDCQLLRPLLLASMQKNKVIADQFLSSEKYEEAYEWFVDLSKKDEGNAEVYQKLGYTCQKLKKYDKANDWYQKADFAKPNHLWTIQHIAQCHKQMGDMAQAIKYYLEAEEIDPDNPNILVVLGECYLVIEDYDNALKRLFKAQFMYPKSIKILRSTAWGTLLARKYKQSYDLYDDVLAFENDDEKFRSSSQDYLNAGHIAWLCGEKTRAANLYIQSYNMFDKEDDFFELMDEDKHYLLERGVEMKDYVIMLEVIRRYGEPKKNRIYF